MYIVLDICFAKLFMSMLIADWLIEHDIHYSWSLPQL